MDQMWRAFGDSALIGLGLAVFLIANAIVRPSRARSIMRMFLLLAWFVFLAAVVLRPGMSTLDAHGAFQPHPTRLLPLSDLIPSARTSADKMNFALQALGNLAMFAPLGFLLPPRKQASLHALAWGLIAGIVIEGIQWLFVTGRVVSADDALLAAIGTVIGANMSQLISRTRVPAVASAGSASGARGTAATASQYGSQGRLSS